MAAKTNFSLDNTFPSSCCTHYLTSINAMRNSRLLIEFFTLVKCISISVRTKTSIV